MKKLVSLLVLLAIYPAYCAENSVIPLGEKPESYSWFAPIESKLESFLRSCGFVSDTVSSQRKELKKQLRDVKSKLSVHESYVAVLKIEIVQSQLYTEMEYYKKMSFDYEKKIIDLKVNLRLKKYRNKQKKYLLEDIKDIKAYEQALLGINEKAEKAAQQLLEMVEFKELEFRKKEIEKLKEKLREILTLLEQCTE